MVVTSRILDELLAADVEPDVLVGSARDRTKPSETDRPAVAPRPDRADRRHGAVARSRPLERLTHRWRRRPGYAGAATPTARATRSPRAHLRARRGPFDRADAVAFAARCGAACASGQGPYDGQLTNLTAADH